MVVGAFVALAFAPGGASAQGTTEMRQTFDPAYEAANFAKTNERAVRLTSLPDYQAQLRAKGTERELEALQILATDGPARPFGRNFAGQLCWQHMDGCAGDVRLYDWGKNGFGTVVPILFTARNGSTLSGHMWRTTAGPAKKPGVVITNGSVQAPEELYWFAAQTLAKAGYVVMTWDPQGQGYSDTFGEGADERDGFPSQTGTPFFDGTEDALDFFFSAPGSDYHPRKSCSSGTSHDAKQVARVKDGRNSSFNPFFAALDPSRVGVLGQSLGAGAVSYIGQIDPRVKAIVAMDNLRAPTSGPACASMPGSRPMNPVLAKPALGLTNDYALFEQAKTTLPDKNAKQEASLALSKLGVDTGSLVVRGGTHFEGAFIPNAGFGSTLRGNDLYAWYLRAWFDKYVKGDSAADAQLLTDRWRRDPLEAAADLTGDGNQFSQYYFSRMKITRSTGGTAVCENLRDGCPATIKADGAPEPYSFLKEANTKDASGGPPSSQGAAGSTGSPPAGQAPAGAGGGSPACRDRTAPVTKPSRTRSTVTRRGFAISGIASDQGCGSAGAGRLTQVTASVALRKGGRCSFLRQNGTFGPFAGCARAPYLAATGTSRWSLMRKVALKPGLYTVVARSVDSVGNFERWLSGRNVLRVRVR